MWISTFFAFTTATKHNTFYIHSSTSAPSMQMPDIMYEYQNVHLQSLASESF